MDKSHFEALEGFARQEGARIKALIQEKTMHHQGAGAAMGRATLMGANATRETIGSPEQSSRTLANDLDSLGRAINSLDDAVTAIGQAVAPVSSVDSRAIEDPSMPPPSSEVSAAVIDAIRRVLIITQRAQVIREQIRL